MKKVKVIGASVAALGIALSVGGALALYTKTVAPVSFGFSAQTYTGASAFYDYTLTNNISTGVEYLDASNNKLNGLTPEVTQIHYSYKMGASYKTGVPAQRYVVGNIKVDFTNVNAALDEKLSVWVGGAGYVEGKYGANHYANKFGEDKALPVTGLSVNEDMAAYADGTATLEIYVKIDHTKGDAIDYTAVDEGKLFDVAITWDRAAAYEYAHVTGSKIAWADEEEYEMVPNLEANDFEWMFSNLAGDMGKSKCKKGDTWSGGQDAQLEPEKTYTVYWSGSDTDAASYQANE